MAAALVVEGLVKRYGERVAVSGVSFSVERGEILGIVGPSGAGKTTAVECVTGLRKPDAGRVSVRGFDPVEDAVAVRSQVGWHLQGSSLPDRMKVWEAVEALASLEHEPVDQGWLLDRWGLLALRNTRCGNLSGEERQRLFIALAMMHDPDLVVLDELTTNVSSAARSVAWDLMCGIRERGSAVVLVTGSMEEAERCDRIAIFNEGQIVATDTPHRLIRRFGSGVRFRFTRPRVETSWIQIVPGVATFVDNGAVVDVRGSNESLPRVCAGLVGRGAFPKDLWIQQAGLRDVVAELTATGRER